jgi:hypothetical protein
LGELTFEVRLFLGLFVKRGQSAGVWQTVHETRILRVFFVFLLVFGSIHFDFELWLEEVSDSPLQQRGQSAGAWRTVRVLPADGPLFGVRY